MSNININKIIINNFKLYKVQIIKYKNLMFLIYKLILLLNKINQSITIIRIILNN